MFILTTEHLTRRFGDLTAVDDLTISVEEGEIFGLLGPNGAGKSTAIKMITTLLPPTSGCVSVGGFDLAHGANQIRRLIGYVPQILRLTERSQPEKTSPSSPAYMIFQETNVRKELTSRWR